MGLTVLDAGVLIGFLDRNDGYHVRAREALQQALDRNDQLTLPALAFAETLVGPLRRGGEAASIVYELIERLPVEVASVDAGVAATAAGLRARHPALKLPDALVIATAFAVGADRLVTTDRKWPSRRDLGLRATITVL